MISFKFLEDARLPALDGTLSPNTQSLLVEVLFWAISYTIFAQVFSRVFRAIYRRSKVWTHARERIGIFCGNGRDDSVLLTCFGIHHGSAAYLMYWGMVHDQPMTWRHGYLIETGFEVADLVAMTFSFYPYKHDGMKDDIKAALIVHHVPGIVLSAFVMETGLYENEHLQKIVLALLGGALVSCVCAVFTYSLDFKTQMTQAAFAYCLNILFFIWCRWYVYPIESFALIQDVRSDPKLNGGVLTTLLCVGGILMGLFNLGILLDVAPKMVRYCKRAVDGVTPIDTEPVPSSRDSILSKRRSSIMLAVDAVNPAATKAKRSSLVTIMGLNTVEDLVHTERDNPAKQAALGAITEDDEGIAADDLAALNRTISSMSDKKSQ